MLVKELNIALHVLICRPDISFSCYREVYYNGFDSVSFADLQPGRAGNMRARGTRRDGTGKSGDRRARVTGRAGNKKRWVTGRAVKGVQNFIGCLKAGLPRI